MNNIGEQDRHLLVLGPGFAVVGWGTTSVAKPGVL
jgi:hypothetical protein